MAVSPYVTREELEDAKNELRDLSKKRIELLEGIERDKKERDERISPEELQMLMFPVENVVRRIQELTYLIGHAQIVEKPSIGKELVYLSYAFRPRPRRPSEPHRFGPPSPAVFVPSPV